MAGIEDRTGALGQLREKIRSITATAPRHEAHFRLPDMRDQEDSLEGDSAVDKVIEVSQRPSDGLATVLLRDRTPETRGGEELFPYIGMHINPKRDIFTLTSGIKRRAFDGNLDIVHIIGGSDPPNLERVERFGQTRSLQKFGFDDREAEFLKTPEQYVRYLEMVEGKEEFILDDAGLTRQERLEERIATREYVHVTRNLLALEGAEREEGGLLEITFDVLPEEATGTAYKIKVREEPRQGGKIQNVTHILTHGGIMIARYAFRPDDRLGVYIAGLEVGYHRPLSVDEMRSFNAQLSLLNPYTN